MREKVDYDYGHINGARNIPITVFNCHLMLFYIRFQLLFDLTIVMKCQHITVGCFNTWSRIIRRHI
ncbi:hypothetical protein ACWEH1_30085 [Micromonospora chersina]